MNNPAASGRCIKIILRPKGRGIKPEERSEFWLLAYLAETLGFYKEEGLEVTFIPCSAQNRYSGLRRKNLNL